jgi:hypothetical protein
MPADAPLWVLQYQLLSIAVFALPFAMQNISPQCGHASSAAGL